MTEVEKSADTELRLDVLFDRVLLIDVRQVISKINRADYTALAALTQPPPPILQVLKAVVLLVQPEPSTVDLDWTQCQTVRRQ